MKLGIFGGTFDPPHIGHQILASECLFQLGLDLILWVLTPHPPHKQGIFILSTEIRLAMVKAAIEDNPSFELSRADIDRPPPHYAVDTLRKIRQEHPRDDLFYLMGGDSLRDLPTWHMPQTFVEACDSLGVMRRPGDEVNLADLEARLPGISRKIRFIEAPLIEISASEIRRRAAHSEPFRYYLPQAVYEMIVKNELYKYNVISNQ